MKTSCTAVWRSAVACAPLAFGLAAMLVAAAPASGQTPDVRWNDWIGCWNLIADGNVARLPPAEDAAGGITGPIRPGSSRAARVCLSPSRGGAELRTMVGEQQVLTQTIIADGADHPITDPGCAGTQRAQWSADGFRLFTRAEVTCDAQPLRTVTGLALLAPDGDWVDVQAVAIAGTESVRVRRYRPPVEKVRAGVPKAAVRLQIDDVTEASGLVAPRAIEAALVETSARFPLSSRALVDLDKAGVDDRVIDLMVALSYPRKFAVRPSPGPDDRLTPFPPLYGGADFVDASLDYPYFYGPYYSSYYYSPYFFSPFGYSYLRYYPQFFAPGVVVIPGGGGGGSGGGGKPPLPENGRAINGLGYTRVDRRDHVTPTEGDASASTPRSAGSRGTVSPRGYTASEPSSSSSGSSSSGSSGGSSSSSSGGGGGSSAGSSDGGGRSAVPR